MTVVGVVVIHRSCLPRAPQARSVPRGLHEPAWLEAATSVDWRTKGSRKRPKQDSDGSDLVLRDEPVASAMWVIPADRRPGGHRPLSGARNAAERAGRAHPDDKTARNRGLTSCDTSPVGRTVASRGGFDRTAQRTRRPLPIRPTGASVVAAAAHEPEHPVSVAPATPPPPRRPRQSGAARPRPALAPG